MRASERHADAAARSFDRSLTFLRRSVERLLVEEVERAHRRRRRLGASATARLALALTERRLTSVARCPPAAGLGDATAGGGGGVTALAVLAGAARGGLLLHALVQLTRQLQHTTQ